MRITEVATWRSRAVTICTGDAAAAAAAAAVAALTAAAATAVADGAPARRIPGDNTPGDSSVLAPALLLLVFSCQSRLPPPRLAAPAAASPDGDTIRDGGAVLVDPCVAVRPARVLGSRCGAAPARRTDDDRRIRLAGPDGRTGTDDAADDAAAAAESVAVGVATCSSTSKLLAAEASVEGVPPPTTPVAAPNNPSPTATPASRSRGTCASIVV